MAQDGTSSYWRSVVIMSLSCIVSEIKQNIGRQFFHTLPFDDPVRGFPLEYCHKVWCEKTRM